MGAVDPPVSESAVVSACLVALSAQPGVRVFRNNTGAIKMDHRMVRFGLAGSADILGIIAPHGRVLAVECKSATGRQSKQQSIFQRVIERHGGLYILCKSSDECLRLFSQGLQAVGSTQPLVDHPNLR